MLCSMWKTVLVITVSVTRQQFRKKANPRKIYFYKLDLYTFTCRANWENCVFHGKEQF